MTTHDRFLEFAAVEIDFELADNEREALERHLEACPACRAEAAALRSDAQAILNLPQPRLDPERADQILGNALVRKRRRPSIRLVALAGLIALLALGAVAVGAEVIRQSVRPALVVLPPSLPPSTIPSLDPPAASGSPAIESWEIANVGEPGSLPEGFTAVASSGSTYVTVGGKSCVASGDGSSGCWADVYRSTDGRRWTKVDTAQSSLEIGTAITLSGPTPGMLDVGGGEQGFVAIGYTGDDVVTAALWWSSDGLIWERLVDGSFADAELRAVVNVGGRWVVAGVIVVDAAPRGAVWWSDDGKSWSRVPDSASFEVGGYIDTGEAPGAGGIRALATDGVHIVGVGSVCDPEGESCVAAIWTSDDGIRWDRQEGRDLPGEGALVYGGYVVHGDAGFLVVGSSCPATGCVGVGLQSPDGRNWTEVSQAGLGDIRGVAAVTSGFVIATMTQTTPPGLALVGSTDGRSWLPLDGIPPVDNGVLSAVDMTPTLDGRVIVVARFEVHERPPTSIVLEVGPAAR